MKPYYQDDAVTIYHGDALDVLRAGVITNVGAVIADPPYCSGGRQQVGARAFAYGNTSGKTEADWFDGDNMGTDSYVWWLREIGRSLFDAVDTGAHFYCFTDWRQYSQVVTAFETVRWTLRSCVVWDKKRGGAMGSFWRNNHEIVPVFSKGIARPLPHGGFFNVLSATKPQADEHPTVKPLTVIQPLVEASGGGVVLDPFLGSGTTLRAAKNLGHRAIGIEIEERYCEIAAARCAQEVLDMEAA